MSARGATTRRRLARAAFVPVAGALAFALAAAPAGAQTQGNNLPFARGRLVSRSGATLDIQGFNGDSLVIVTSSTRYQRQETADASAVKVGDCIRVTGTGSASKGITASNVALSPAASNCTRGTGIGAGGFAGRFRNRNGANGNGTPNGNFTPNGSAPNGGTNNPDRRNLANFGAVTGKVTKVSGDKVVVKGTIVQPPTKANGKAKTLKKTVNVTLATATRFDQTVAATADALTVGTCVTAAGTADSVGTVTANTVTVSQPVNGSCNNGFGFGGGRGRFGPGGDPNGTQNGGQNGTGSTGSA